MRVFNCYSFTVGHVPFPELFTLVDRFLQEQGLHYQQLCYDLRDLKMEKSMRIAFAQEKRVIPRRKNATVSDLWDLVRDMPQLDFADRIRDVGERDYLLSDMDDFGQPRERLCPEADVRRLAECFPMPYYLDSMLFSYANVDFFGKAPQPVKEDSCKMEISRRERKGCHITFSKDALVFSRAAKLTMVIEVTDGDAVLDSAPYASALAQILGKKYTAQAMLYLSEEEQGRIKESNAVAQPLLDRAAAALKAEIVRFGQQTPREQWNIQDTLFSVGKSLKKIGKSFGFGNYEYDPMGVHFMSRKLAGGQSLMLVVDVPPRWNEMRLRIRIGGLGFCNELKMAELYCESQERADGAIQTAFEILRDLEKEQLQPICELYPPTPDWYTVRTR